MRSSSGPSSPNQEPELRLGSDSLPVLVSCSRIGTENAKNDDERKDSSVSGKDKLKQYQRRKKKTSTTRDNDVNSKQSKQENIIRVFDPVEEKVVSVSTEMDITDSDEPGLNETHLVSICQGSDGRTGFGGNQNQSVVLDERRSGEEDTENEQRLNDRIDEKGKGKLFLVDDIDPVEWNLEPNERHLILDAVESLLLLPHLEMEIRKSETKMIVKDKALRRKMEKKELNAKVIEAGSKFAHFQKKEEEEEARSGSQLPVVANMEIKDWEEDPYSIAMRIITDQTPKIDWVPIKIRRPYCPRPTLSSLQDLCTKILAKNSEAVPLEYLPDEVRDKLSQLVCDSQKMDFHLMDRLVSGSPSEIRVKNCSLITEEQLLRSLKKCDTKNLTVLQLDLCGRCMSDHVLLGTLARSQNSLPALASISLRGACHLTDVGLSAIVGSARALRYVNLGNCSLLTSSCIDALADSLGPELKVLHIDDCPNIDALKILPALKKLKNLEVLSVAGIETVCDDFVCEFISEHGSKMKEFILADCGKLTDISLKVIGEKCTQLCALDLFNVHKLSDYSMQYLANGCQSIQKLKLCRNKFSDEAIAAFLEAAGKSLTELSLNYVKKVSRNTAISIANRCSENLLILDLSWCRNLVDEEVGFIVDKCSKLRLLKLFGCSQITNIFLEGHTNSHVQIFGLHGTPIL
ncbi:Leucine-rich repeat [Macleaya cordata]|uniref:Leucine-rich repeat n=1 Tax=Macleaya cordata TaxID=56857 RepID=A0A200QD03_MACCD|nr:Leucine-rich repeat [Macleaya cordata]